MSKVYDIIAIDSPVNIQAINTKGEKSGIATQSGEDVILREIPGSDYIEFAGTKYLILPNDEDLTIHLSGYEEGRYTLTIASLSDDDVQVVRTQLRDATTTSEMVATFTLENGVYGTIVTDLDGDGVPESETTLNGEPIAIDQASFEDLRTMIKDLELSHSQEKLLLVSVTLAEKFNAKSSSNKLFARATKRALDGLERQLRYYKKRGLISESESGQLQLIITQLSNGI